ncbi:unnamed protein product, partial [Rangifer tarandus platyrhynchus]
MQDNCKGSTLSYKGWFQQKQSSTVLGRPHIKPAGVAQKRRSRSTEESATETTTSPN